MKGNKEIIGILNHLLPASWRHATSISFMPGCTKTGATKRLFRTYLARDARRDGTRRLADSPHPVPRGKPEMVPASPLKIGKNVPEMLKSDLAVEYLVVADLKKAIVRCESAGDYVTREGLEDARRYRRGSCALAGTAAQHDRDGRAQELSQTDGNSVS